MRMKVTYIYTPETDEIIREAYRLRYGHGNTRAIAGAAKKLGWPKYAVSRRAGVLGLQRLKRPAAWTDAEDQVLEKYAAMSLKYIAEKLKQETGSRRTECAISQQLTRLRAKASVDGWSIESLATNFGVRPHKIRVWVQRGMLDAQHTGITDGAGERRFISRKAVRDFILNHPEEVDHRSCEKYFLLDIVSGGKLCEQFRREVA